MSDPGDLAEIRERKRRELAERAAGDGAEEASGDESTPPEPVYVDDAEHLETLTDRFAVVLVDYYADWCGPCQMLEPIVGEIARETDAAVAKVDIDRHQDLATDAGVRGVPTLFLYVDGEPIERFVGLQDAGTLRDLVERHA